MLRIKEYVKAESLKQAYELNQKKSNCILGGMLWLKMETRNVQTAIDLSGLGLDKIEETEEEFSIGCMVTLRQLEEDAGLNRFTDGAVRESVRSIVGVQFRNLATVGGSIFGRFGFSDVLTMFLALDTYVELYHGGIVPLQEFAAGKRDRDILVRLIVKKMPVRCVYLSHRNTKTDFPVLTCAVSVDGRGGRAVVGARPGRAVCIPIEEAMLDELGLAETGVASVQSGAGVVAGGMKGDADMTADSVLEEAAAALAARVVTGSNMRASAEYRSLLAKVLIKRGLAALTEGRRFS
ncbi:MAG: FAD binding domain-containing protein [Lachnospiraceae bacterium]